MQVLKDIAAQCGCYKVILDCAEHNVKFYEKCGFLRKELQMAMYLPEKPHARL
jgi:glucosamine-phosphate N-acetyltransferase